MYIQHKRKLGFFVLAILPLLATACFALLYSQVSSTIAFVLSLGSIYGLTLVGIFIWWNIRGSSYDLAIFPSFERLPPGRAYKVHGTLSMFIGTSKYFVTLVESISPERGRRYYLVSSPKSYRGYTYFFKKNHGGLPVKSITEDDFYLLFCAYSGDVEASLMKDSLPYANVIYNSLNE